MLVDTSKASLKEAVMHIRNTKSSAPVAHAAKLTQGYDTMKPLLNAIQYQIHSGKNL